MPFPHLDETQRLKFPDANEADEDGILAAGGNLSPGMLLSAYEQGIFPWYSDREPILWWAPDPRFILYPAELHVSKSLKKKMRRNIFSYSCDTVFSRVIDHCSTAERPGQDGTWITEEMKHAYIDMHNLGYAHSFEVWQGDELAGGLYGISLGSFFFGESMFSLVPDASKACFVKSVEFSRSIGIEVIDSQVYTDHLARFGAREIPRREYMKMLRTGLQASTKRGSWKESFLKKMYQRIL